MATNAMAGDVRRFQGRFGGWKGLGTVCEKDVGPLSGLFLPLLAIIRIQEMKEEFLGNAFATLAFFPAKSFPCALFLL